MRKALAGRGNEEFAITTTNPIERLRVRSLPFPRFLEGDNEAMKINDENRRTLWG